MDYIHYSALTGKAGSNMGSCTQECGKGLFSQKCCAGLNAQQGDSKEFWYACIDRSLAAADMTMNVANYSVNIKCVESGSMKIAGLTASALLALVSAI